MSSPYMPPGGPPFPPPPQPPPWAAPRRRRPWWQWAVAAVAVLTVLGGGLLLGRSALKPASSRFAGTRGSTSSPPATGTGYLASDSGDVLFIQWNDDNGHIDGTVQVVTASGNPPDASTTSNTVSVTGSIQGSSISLSFDGSPLQFGTVAGGSFSVNFPGLVTPSWVPDGA